MATRRGHVTALDGTYKITRTPRKMEYCVDQPPQPARQLRNTCTPQSTTRTTHAADHDSPPPGIRIQQLPPQRYPLLGDRIRRIAPVAPGNRPQIEARAVPALHRPFGLLRRVVHVDATTLRRVPKAERIEAPPAVSSRNAPGRHLDTCTTPVSPVPPCATPRTPSLDQPPRDARIPPRSPTIHSTYPFQTA